MSTPDPKTVREIATEIILDCGRNADDVGAYVRIRVGDDLSKHEHEAWCSAIRTAIRTAVVTVEWPDEQQPGDVVTAEQQQDGAAEELRTFLAALPPRIDIVADWTRGGVRNVLTAEALRAVLTERTALAARVAELESEHEADTRAVNRLLRLAEAEPALNYGPAAAAVRARFADRIATLDADSDGGAE